jgi:hypothetical protein
MKNSLAAVLLGLGIVTGAHAAGSGSITGAVVPNPLKVSLALSSSNAVVGTQITAVVTVQNLGVAPLSNVTVTLNGDPNIAIAGGDTRTLGTVAGTGSGQVSWQLCAVASGGYVVLAKATAGALTTESTAQLLNIGPGSGQCAEDATATLPAGGTLSTDREGDGATAADPIETAVTTPTGGRVSIDERKAAATAPTGLYVVGWQVQISAPVASTSAPLRIVFEIDSSLLVGVDPLSLQTARNGLVVASCPSDPCLEGRVLQADGDLALTIVTSAASTWTFTTIYPFTGFLAPVDNPPVINGVKAGLAVPVKFSLGGDRGLTILAADYPQSQRVTCDSGAHLDEIGQTVNAGVSSLSYDVSTGEYTYVWKTDKTWAGTCRQLVIRLVDGTDHRAIFKLR